MQVEIQINKDCTEPKVVIFTDKITEETQALLRQLSEIGDVITGFREDTAEILEIQDIYSIYAANKRVYARTKAGEYTLRLRLYEVEEKLRKEKFVRISNSEIINLHKVKQLDLSLAGTICLRFTDGKTAYVSRRYVGKIKEILGI